MEKSAKRITGDAWTRAYYESAIGLEIIGVELREDEFSGEKWPVLKAVRKAKGKATAIVELEIARDEEGNGPGFVFGLLDPNPVED